MFVPGLFVADPYRNKGHGLILKPLDIFGASSHFITVMTKYFQWLQKKPWMSLVPYFWDVKALKNPPPTPGLNSSLKNTPQIQKCNLEREAGF